MCRFYVLIKGGGLWTSFIQRISSYDIGNKLTSYNKAWTNATAFHSNSHSTGEVILWAEGMRVNMQAWSARFHILTTINKNNNKTVTTTTIITIIKFIIAQNYGRDKK